MLKVSLPKKKHSKLIAGAILALVSIGLWQAKVDRQYINMQPTEGIESGIILSSDKNYEQVFISERSNISSISLFFRPARLSMPDEKITIMVKQNNQSLGQQTISSAFIDSEGASKIDFVPPIQTQAGETVISINLPSALDQAIRLQERLPDETFDPTPIPFRIDGEIQPNPVAHLVFHKSHPILATHLSGLFLLGAILLFVPAWPVYIVGVSLIFAAPAILLGQLPFSVIAYSAISLSGMIVLLRSYKLSLLPTLLGAHIFAFTTWLPLHAAAGRSYYVLVATLPLLLIFFNRTAVYRKKNIVIALVMLAILVIPIGDWNSSIAPESIASPRDIFVDTNQVPDSIKVNPPASWDNFGSYIGIISAILALIGLVTHGLSKSSHKFIVLGLLGALISITPGLINSLASFLPIPPQHFIILTTLALAYFAARGLQSLSDFLQSDKEPADIVLSTIIFLITLIVLLDLWQIAGATLEVNLL